LLFDVFALINCINQIFGALFEEKVLL